MISTRNATTRTATATTLMGMERMRPSVARDGEPHAHAPGRSYYTMRAGRRTAENAAWRREEDVAAIEGNLAFYPDRASSCRAAECPAARSMALEELHGALVALRGSERLEGAEVLALARARVLLARVEAELAGLELADHASKLRMPSRNRRGRPLEGSPIQTGRLELAPEDHEGFVRERSLRDRSEEHTSELQSRENLVC